MGDLKPLSHKQFNEFMKGKEFKGWNDYKLKELKAKFGFSSEDMEPTTFNSLRKDTKASDVTYGALRYAKDKERDFVKKMRRYVR